MMSMLVLSRYVGESVCIDNVAIWVIAITNGEVSFLVADASIDLSDSVSTSTEGVFTARLDDTFDIESKPATVTVVEIRDDKVRIGIECPQDVPVHSKEVYDAIQAIIWRKRNFEMQEGDCVCVDRNGVSIEAIESDSVRLRVTKVADPYSLTEPIRDFAYEKSVDYPDENRLLAIGDSFSPDYSMTRITLLSIENGKAAVEFEYPEGRETVESLDEIHKRLDREEVEAQKSPFGISRVETLRKRKAAKAVAVANDETVDSSARKPFWGKLTSIFTR